MKLLAIDGNSIVNRAYYGVRPLRNTQGVYTHAIFGFLNIIRKNMTESGADAVVAAFDLKAPTFRHKAVESYKANRKGMPEELAMQMPYLRQLLPLLGLHILTCEGYEADDILGTLAAACTGQNVDCEILTGDRDSLQLINDRVTVRLATNRETICYTPQRFEEEYGFAPHSLIDLKALMGDSSDNISGVSGIGQKTASKLIQAWGTIESLYDHLDEAELTKSVYTKLQNGAEDAKQSKWLATIVTDAPIDTNIAAYRLAPVQKAQARDLLLELEMAKMLKTLGLDDVADESLPASGQDIPAESDAPLEEVELTEAIMDEWDRSEPGIVPACLFDGATLYAVHPDMPGKVFLTTDESLWIRMFARGRCTFGAKHQYRFLLHKNVLEKILDTWQLENDNLPAMDVEIAAYLLDPTSSSYEIERLCVTYHVPYPKELGKYADVLVLMPLCRVLLERVQAQGMRDLLKKEHMLTLVLAEMEHVGVGVSNQALRSFGEYLAEQMEQAQQVVYAEAGHTFNIGSPKQLGEVLFVEKGLPHGKKTKTGYSTNAEILEKLRGEPMVDAVLQWRQYSKLKSTYVDGLLKVLGEDGRIHSWFRQTETRTGRISSTEPNLQNIPVRTELGRNMRKFFVAEPGNVLIDADYSQIELRLLANLSGDKQMQQAFLSGADIHAATAAQVFGMPPEMVTPEMRSAAKAVNFGILYGMGAFSLSQDIHVSVQQANQYIQNYMAQFPSVKAFMEKTVEQAKQDGYVTTYFHRRRPVPELLSSNKMVQAAGRRIAMNTPIQGTAADIIKLAMIQVYKRLKGIPSAQLILQVHDELIVEVEEPYANEVEKALKEEMEQVIHNTLPESSWADFPVPLTVDVHRGRNWYEAKG